MKLSSRWIIVLSAAAACAVAVLAALVLRDGDDETVSTDTTAATTAQSTVTTEPVASSSTTAPTAVDDLSDFFSAAAELDGRLKAAADAINAGATGAEVVVDQPTVDLVQAAREQLDEVGAAVPAGMGPELLRATLLVYSDLASRVYAMNRWARFDPESPRIPLAEVLPCLENGSRAAARYPDDVAALRTLAESARSTPRAAPESRVAEEIAVRVQNVEAANSCCDNCGGYLATGPLDEIEFEDAPTVDPETGFRTDGYISQAGRDPQTEGVPFQADFEPGTGWVIQFLAG